MDSDRDDGGCDQSPAVLLVGVRADRYGYCKCGSDVFSLLDNTNKHMESTEKRMAFVQDRFATNGLVRWPKMRVEATDGGRGGRRGATTLEVA